MKRSAGLRIAGLTLVLLAACDYSGPGHITQVPKKTLPEELLAANLRRTYTVTPATPTETAQMRQLETPKLLGLPRDLRWDGWIQYLKAYAGIANDVDIFATPDLRNAVDPSLRLLGGGFVQNSFVVLDGKFLDILDDYATWRTMYDLGLTSQPVGIAIDQIVDWHLRFKGTAPYPYYNVTYLPDDAFATRDYHFANVASIMLYHEFGHYFQNMMLQYLRGTVGSMDYVHPAALESQADAISGILTYKTSRDATEALLAFDFMTFYSAYKNPRYGYTSSFQIDDNFALQYAADTGTYASLGSRKQTFLAGYSQLAQLVTALTSASFAADSTFAMALDANRFYGDARDQNAQVQRAIQERFGGAAVATYQLSAFRSEVSDDQFALKISNSEPLPADSIARIRAAFKATLPDFRIREDGAIYTDRVVWFMWTWERKEDKPSEANKDGAAAEAPAATPAPSGP